MFVYPSILRKLRLTCRTQDASARGWLGRRRGQDAGRTRALCGPDTGRVDARRGPDAGRRSAKLFPGGYDKLPVPFGLVRFAVAPDHPETKVGSCIVTL